jgi:hypothetical protein
MALFLERERVASRHETRLRGYGSGMPYTVMKSAFREAERLQGDEPDRFDQIVTEATVAEPELATRDPLSLVALWVYDQRLNTGALDGSEAHGRPPEISTGTPASGGGMAPGRPGTPASDEAAQAEIGSQEAPPDLAR